jgi:hypothetical protein
MRPGVCQEQEGAPQGVACLEVGGPDGVYMWCVPCKGETIFTGVEHYVTHRACGY